MKNTSGIKVIEYKVLVLPDPVEQKTKGGIILTDDTIEQSQAAATRGTVIDVSPLAFNYEADFPQCLKPMVGTRVIMGRYNGVKIMGADGIEYRILNDKDIIGVER